MPFYNFECKDCGNFVARRKVDERKNPIPCPKCGKLSKYSPTFETQPPIFVGSGFYQTDYKKKQNS